MKTTHYLRGLEITWHTGGHTAQSRGGEDGRRAERGGEDEPAPGSARTRSSLRFCRLFFTGEFEAWEAAKMVTKKPGVEDWFFSLAP